ncbi:MAG: hypothetical protein ABH854_00165 [Candidatus Diapherotrites archaeon]|nr:hypothetical protein [Candidatus Micrarchaeota archaeon]MBU1939344.1 hypothetical protein [Candidatus Micrarchaeota archaeon]
MDATLRHSRIAEDLETALKGKKMPSFRNTMKSLRRNRKEVAAKLWRG